MTTSLFLGQKKVIAFKLKPSSLRLNSTKTLTYLSPNVSTLTLSLEGFMMAFVPIFASSSTFSM